MATSNVNSVFQIGGSPLNNTSGVPNAVLPISDYGKLLTLTSRVNSGSYHPFYAHSSQAASGIYQVPSGKTLFVARFSVTPDTTGVNRFRFGYATATFADPTASPTGLVLLGTTGNPFIFNLSANATQDMNFQMSFPALSFPCVTHDAGAVIDRFVLVGFEL